MRATQFGKASALAGLAICAAVVVAVALLASARGTSAVVTAPEVAAPIEELTGEDVGLALGLEPLRWGDAGVACPTVFAQYDNPLGFCIGPVVDDEVEEMILAFQIMGYERTDLVEANAEIAVALGHSSDLEESEHIELMRRAADLREQLAQQGTVDD